MGIVLEVLGMLGIVGGIVLSITGTGLPLGLIVILEGVVLFTIGSIYRTVKATRRELKEMATRTRARTIRTKKKK